MSKKVCGINGITFPLQPTPHSWARCPVTFHLCYPFFLQLFGKPQLMEYLSISNTNNVSAVASRYLLQIQNPSQVLKMSVWKWWMNRKKNNIRKPWLKPWWFAKIKINYSWRVQKEDGFSYLLGIGKIIAPSRK